jgi:hypothetical protein
MWDVLQSRESLIAGNRAAGKSSIRFLWSICASIENPARVGHRFSDSLHHDFEGTYVSCPAVSVIASGLVDRRREN